jgi:hypothetical protein
MTRMRLGLLWSEPANSLLWAAACYDFWCQIAIAALLTSRKAYVDKGREALLDLYGDV